MTPDAPEGFIRLQLNTTVAASVQELWTVDVPTGTDLSHENLLDMLDQSKELRVIRVEDVQVFNEHDRVIDSVEPS